MTDGATLSESIARFRLELSFMLARHQYAMDVLIFSHLMEQAREQSEAEAG